jgi:hypothetical protein
MENKTYTITKKIAKHGKQAVIIVPTLLQNQLSPGTLVQVTFDVIGGEDE